MTGAVLGLMVTGLMRQTVVGTVVGIGTFGIVLYTLLLWPLSGWTWSSPVSYYDPLYYGGREFFPISHALIFVVLAVLLVRRTRWRGKGPESKRP